MTSKLQKIAISTAGVVSTAMTTTTIFAAGVGQVTAGTGFAQDMGKLISSVLTIVMVVAILLVLLYLIMGGIEWITSGGDKGKTESARNKITAAIIGIIILAAAYALTTLVAYVLGFDSFQGALNALNGARINGAAPVTQPANGQPI